MGYLPTGNINFFSDPIVEESSPILDLSLQPYFPLRKYGYILRGALNNRNRWHIKIVHSIFNREFGHYVSTTYAKNKDYLKLIETIIFLKCNDKLCPRITDLYPQENTIVCEHIGELLSSSLLNKPVDIARSLTSVFEYLNDLNSINQNYKTFEIPFIVKTALELPKEFGYDFEFLPMAKTALSRLESSGHKFVYGYGIEDPHIWNFRIVKKSNNIAALTTDYDYCSDKINCFWELGYLFATFRWLKKSSLTIVNEAEEVLLSLIRKVGLKSEFMFWLGALSSYCGYKDSLRNLITEGRFSILEKYHKIILTLDQKVSSLADRLLTA